MWAVWRSRSIQSDNPMELAFMRAVSMLPHVGTMISSLKSIVVHGVFYTNQRIHQPSLWKSSICSLYMLEHTGVHGIAFAHTGTVCGSYIHRRCEMRITV